MIRPLHADDAPAAAAIYNHYVTNTTATFQTDPVTPDEWLAEASAGEPGRHGAWAVEGDAANGGRHDAAHDAAHGGGLDGYLLVSPFKSRCAYRDTAEVTVYLAPRATGHGLGRAALAYAEEHARAAGLHALLAVVCAENDASLRAFERAGYERVAQLREVGTKFGRRLDVVYLEKVLA